MWKYLVCLFLIAPGDWDRTSVMADKFGHVTGDFNTPNMLDEGSTELSYPFSDQPTPGSWFKFKVQTLVINDPAQCYSGNECVRVSQRPNDGLSHMVYYRRTYADFEVGSTYMFNFFVKLTADYRPTRFNDSLVELKFMYRSFYTNPAGHPEPAEYIRTFREDVKVDRKWNFISIRYNPTEAHSEFTFVDFFLKVPGEIDYVIDAASLTKVSYPDWKAEAEANIASNRMGKINVHVKADPVLDLNNIEIRVSQKKKHFPFGAAVNATIIGGLWPDTVMTTKYRQWILDHVTWVSFDNAAKWKQMELLNQDDTDWKFRICDAAVEWFLEKNIKMRGHAIHWNKVASTPNWIPALPWKQQGAAIDRRTNYDVVHFRGKFNHWDVLNEFTVSRTYQDWSGRDDIQESLHIRTRELDPTVKRFTNEWGNLHVHFHFTDTVDAILKLRSKKLIDGIGLQAHFKTFKTGGKLDMDIIKRRLDIFASLGIPVWITEFTVKHWNATTRGELLKDCLTLFYGTPGVEGIVIWDPAPDPNSPALGETALLNKADLTNTDAGQAFDEILESWTTNTVLGPPATHEEDLSTTAYYGTYDIAVIYDGVVAASITDVMLTPDNPTLNIEAGLEFKVSLDLADN